VSRALPDVRDGLKPVQRRILWSMHKNRLRPETSYRKSATVVGDVMAKYHPHGDAAIYDTMVRMAQPFANLVPPIDGQGNFGTLDDPAAAARYTEAKHDPGGGAHDRGAVRRHRRHAPQLRRQGDRTGGDACIGCRTCWSTARPVSPSVSPPAWRRTTSSRSSPPSSIC
jgi:hypothetical protein